MKKWMLLLFGLLCFSPFHVYALTGKTLLTCDQTSIVPGGTTNCSLQGNVTDDMVSAVHAEIKGSSNLTVESIKVDSIWQGTSDTVLDLYTDTNKSGTFAMVTFVVKASNSIVNGSDETITVDAIKFYDNNDAPNDIAKITQSIRIQSTVNTLSSIQLTDASLSPSFSANHLQYTAVSNADTAVINVVKSDSKSTVTGNVGKVNLNYGANTFRITVTSESNAVKTYTLTVTRPDNRSTDHSLFYLILNTKDISLVDDQVDYTYEVESNVSELDIEAALNDSKASFVEGYGPRTVSLTPGENRIELKVRAENETIQTYTLIVNRKEEVVNNDTTNNEATTNGESTNQKVDNPKTGMVYVYIVFVLVLVSVVLGVYFYKQYQKKKGNVMDEKK